MASLNTREPARDEHLRSPDFFDAENSPQLRFESTEIRSVGDDVFEIVGQLEMRGVTREITLTAELQGRETDPWGNERVGLEVSGELKRGDWGLTWNQVLGSGNLLVADKVKLALDISAIQQS